VADTTTPPDDLMLLRAFEPVVRFNEGELFFPAAVDEYVACCELLEHVPGEDPRAVVENGALTIELLAEVGAANRGPEQFLRFVDEPFSWWEAARWRHRPDRPRFRQADRLARVGVLSRIVDALMRVSLFFRGSVAHGAEAAAETKYRERIRRDHHPYYGRVVRSAGYVALQYWMFYAFNDWRSRVYGVNDHEADWEQVVVYLAEQADGSLLPSWVVFSAHDETGDDLRRRWDDPDLTLVDGAHPLVFAGIGSHSGAYLEGEYLTTLNPPAFKGLVRFFRSITRTLLPWTRGQTHAGVGIPYVDFARGDGLAIGPGHDREWAPVVIDDDTPWVVDYRGLWGNDTDDPLGGERGPAGPRYERSGEVRHCWGDVVGWSGLAKIAPNATAAGELIVRRLDELDVETKAVAAEVEAERTTLRADVAGGVPVASGREADLDRLAARRVELHDERRRLRRRLVDPPPDAGPHDHLTHRNLPMPTESRTRRRLLSVWSAVSTPLILGVIALLFLPGQATPVVGTILAWLFILLAVEALARRNLFRFLSTLVVLALAVIVITTLAGLFVFYGWQTTVAICLGVFAIVLLVINLQELARD
jgi:hypothetical protein